MSDPICDITYVHEDIVKEVQEDLSKEEEILDLADLFKIFADSTRLKILMALSKAELCVCDLACLIGMSQSTVSHQLRTLKQARLVKYRREGKVIFYSLDDEHIHSIIGAGREHLEEL